MASSPRSPCSCRHESRAELETERALRVTAEAELAASRRAERAAVAEGEGAESALEELTLDVVQRTESYEATIELFKRRLVAMAAPETVRAQQQDADIAQLAAAAEAAAAEGGGAERSALLSFTVTFCTNPANNLTCPPLCIII